MEKQARPKPISPRCLKMRRATQVHHEHAGPAEDVRPPQRAVSRSLGALCWKEFIPDVARRWRQTNATRLAPCSFVDFLFVADCQATGRFRCDEDRVTHFPARTTVLGCNFLPKPKAPKFEFPKLFFDLPAQAIFSALSRALAPSGEHP